MEELRKYLLEKRKGFYIEETATLTIRHHFLSLLFLIVGFFFSSRGEDYAKESEQKVTIDSAKHEKHTKDKEENNSANTVFLIK